MGKRNKKRNLQRCEATGRITNGRPVILADPLIVSDYLKQLGYTVISPSQKFSRAIIASTGLIFYFWVFILSVGGAKLI